MHAVYDVVIIGAGPAGSAAGYYLALRGLDVLLLDKFDFPRDKTCGDGLPPLALHVLEDMGLLETVRTASYRVGALNFVAPKGHAVRVPFPAGYNRPDYSLIVPRLRLDNMLREHAVQAGASFQGTVRVTDVTLDGEYVTVGGEQRGGAVEVRSRAVIVATGSSPALLLRMGILRQPPQMMLAARAYFTGVDGLDEDAHMRFDGVPLPGYGWIFPLGDTAANIGAGFCPIGRAARWLPGTPRVAFEQFTQSAPLQRMLAHAEREGPIKGYPLRVDFHRAPTYGQRVLLVGEAAGLVNPLTGEGVDYALESGRLAAGHLARMFTAGDLSQRQFAAYDRILRQRFQRLFVFCTRARDALLYPGLIDLTVSLAASRPGLKLWLANIVLGNTQPSLPVPGLISTVRQAVRGR